ncbi:CHRD domain-containing protein [Pseudaquabacterium pictum]|uniref:CHRD domain-containing protein n=1 Tax=Pseudaquabacterium pictum TaxID=2315236 RepID=A0A480AQS8_9BURK|nr:CHRD domain-containing protein [Rubrivivax pictus]GCL62452.1 CHRD domain-containing protein [Rubrivivax pictus]
MSKIQRIAPLVRKAVLSLALVAPAAFAGHLNALLNADLDGRQQVNTAGTSAIVGDPNGRGEVYVFGIDANKYTLCYNLQVKRIGELDLAPQPGVRMAHIHAGKRGQNGPVVANLAWPQGGQSADCLDGINQRARFAADVPSVEALIADILANPENYYVNVHNSQYPAGAVRGQLAVAAD